MDDSSLQLEQHYADTGPLLLSYFRREPALASSADDLLQETFLRAWRQRERFHQAVSPRAYLFGIARHVRLDALRRRRPNDPLPEDLAAPAAAVDERLELMRTAISCLPEAMREPLVLKLQHELSYQEIAEVLDVPVGTVRSRLHYAVLRLQEALTPGSNSKPSHSP